MRIWRSRWFLTILILVMLIFLRNIYFVFDVYQSSIDYEPDIIDLNKPFHKNNKNVPGASLRINKSKTPESFNHNKRKLSNSLLEKTTLCPSLERPNIVRELQIWQAVIDGGTDLYGFSAFYDDVDETAVIRIIGIMARKPNVKIYCQMWYDDDVLVVIESNIMKWGTQGVTRKYSSIFFLCPLPTREKPQSVSLSTQKCRRPNSDFHILSSTNRENNFTVCVKPFNFQYGRAYELVEWIESNRMFGAEYFVFYNYSTNTNVDRVLKTYADEGLIQVVQWHLPVAVDKYPPPPNYSPDLASFGQQAAINDCLYRHLHSSKYLVMVDVDELVVPRTHASWFPMMSSLPNTAAYIFQNVFFRLEWPDVEWEFPGKADAIRYNITFILKQRRERKIWPSHSRSKYILRPTSVEVAGIHFVITFRGRKSETVVNRSIALLHHYRNWQRYNDKQNRELDTAMGKFQETLISRIASRWIMLPGVPINLLRYWER